MRVQFIWFNLNCTPKMSLGVALLVRELTEAGHRVSVLHLNERVGTPFDTELVARGIRSFDPGLIALSFGRNHLKYATSLLPVLKEAVKDVPLLCGGIHTTLYPEEVIRLPAVDFICIGEADGLMAPFIERLESGQDVSGLPSFWGKKDGRVWRNRMAPLPDIRNQSWIDLDHIDHRAALDYNRGMFEVVAGRGCPEGCTFCFNPALRAFYRRHLPADEPGLPYCRMRSVENLLGEMDEILRRFGDRVKMFSFADDAFNNDRDWVISFCEQYPDRIGLPYTCNLLVKNIDDEVARSLKSSGAIVKIGVESGSERIRCQILGKSFDNRTVQRAISRLKAHGVPTRIYLMVGNPTETREEILGTFRFAASLLAASTRLCIFYPVEGSPIYQRCAREGLLTGREYENYDDLSVLRWDPEMDLFLKKVHVLHPWLQNSYLDGPAAREYAPLVERALAIPPREWDGEECQRWIRSASVDLSRRLHRRKIAHYFNPFPERPDVTFLYTGTSTGLPNVEEPPDVEKTES